MTFGGSRVEAAIVGELLRAVQPMAIEAALEAERMHMQALNEQQRILELELQQARYEAGLAERRYGGVPDEEMLMALSPAHLAKAISGMKQLAKNGLRYPIAPYGIQSDVRAGMGVSYAKK